MRLKKAQVDDLKRKGLIPAESFRGKRDAIAKAGKASQAAQETRQAKEAAQQGFRLRAAAYGLPVPLPEYQFYGERKWRFDWSWTAEKIALEIEGGAWVNGAHNRGKHFIEDMAKYNQAAAEGWAVFRFTPQQIDSGEAFTFIKGVMDARKR